MKSSLRSGFYILLVACSFTVGFGWQDLRVGRLPSDVLGQVLQAPNSIAKPPLTPTQVFKRAFRQISREYYKPVDLNDLKYAGMEGLMAALGDPHTQFFEPELAEQFSNETKGKANFVGVGARLAPDPLGAKVISVFSGGPAANAGIKGADLIIAVDGKNVGGLEIEDIVSKIKGEKGTVVKLTVSRGSDNKILKYSMRRDTVIPPTVESEILKPSYVGYITVYQFAQPTNKQFVRALDEMRDANVRGLVIDMRSNPGGLLETAVEMLSQFVDDKLVVKMKFRGNAERVETTYGSMKRDFPYPIVVLVNEDSASAAEIFAGVLKDYKIATLVGEHTYGKASVQNVFPLMDGASAKITIAQYYLPSGMDMARKVDDDGQYVSGGIKPDVVVPLSLSPETVIGDPKTDNQLQKAIEIIESKR